MPDSRARYELYAGAYERVTRLASLGGIARLYRATADALELEPGTRVLISAAGRGRSRRTCWSGSARPEVSSASTSPPR